MNAVIPVNTVSAIATQPSGNAGNGWALAFPGNLGNIDAYIQSVNRVPMLSAEEEQRLAREYRDNDDLDSARRLVLSHLRLVVSIARQYLGYGLPHADLIQEGNIGLMKAVKRFDPDQGVRLVSYAMHWIKAEMHEYILKNWRMVKVATTKAQRKLFFNLRSHKQDAQATFSPDEISAVAAELNVKGAEVREMETRLSGGDIALEGQMDDGEESFAPIAYLADTHNEPTRVIESRSQDRMQSEGIETALAKLDDRSRRIIEARWLQVNDDGSGGATLHELADEFGVSAERIRQIESAAMKKMKGALQAFA
ncbi:RNA polymerase sigma factor RpoH [Ralstonia insidiosa]|uniref:RNA polymerase sigma factor RpoH n=1 Tax=Ralstonia TaxID=48736 RepID=UPI0006648D49|nr:RNA polymerase sigma factor RpoH [Ralstonia insidiosa]KMW46347.1 RNA polymerase factor sigma-32 [Ralstonia sp. MD27]MBX3771959.1 RNA polymerase sigma factor RpoH [Ralstonia pickettii]NOZ18475.1 RNA polymerase sigma factor RpoH [Betaproteobacteria bacterium]MBA9856056.1 RNA polymerase sigma factor RpoH [Ralstonia insidiosa]MBA9873627.1 RNA polymerase sigma factor RpoH [Ralstonia insidiosa]